MKKLLTLFLVAILAFCLVACNDSTPTSKNQFISLKDNEVLVVGNSAGRFMNYESSTEEVKTLTHTLSVEYTLNRSSYSYSEDYVYYDGYYYHWSTSSKTETETLGTATTKTVYSRSYLPYGENENILVRTTVYTNTTYSYKGGWVNKDVTVDTDLRGYFSSLSDLEEKCPDEI